VKSQEIKSVKSPNKIGEIIKTNRCNPKKQKGLAKKQNNRIFAVPKIRGIKTLY
jgi:hypothetical protein